MTTVKMLTKNNFVPFFEMGQNWEFLVSRKISFGTFDSRWLPLKENYLKDFLNVIDDIEFDLPFKKGLHGHFCVSQWSQTFTKSHSTLIFLNKLEIFNIWQVKGGFFSESTDAFVISCKAWTYYFPELKNLNFREF